MKLAWAIRIARSDLEAFVEERSAGSRVGKTVSRPLLPAHGAEGVPATRLRDNSSDLPRAELESDDGTPSARDRDRDS